MDFQKEKKNICSYKYVSTLIILIRCVMLYIISFLLYIVFTVKEKMACWFLRYLEMSALLALTIAFVLRFSHLRNSTLIPTVSVKAMSIIQSECNARGHFENIEICPWNTVSINYFPIVCPLQFFFNCFKIFDRWWCQLYRVCKATVG